VKESPEYRAATAAGRQVARFGGRDLEIAVGRVRAYPGLAGEAPDTRGYYAAAVEKLAGATRVLDVGAGSGNGARILRSAFMDVVAIDEAREAAEFVRAHDLGVQVVHGGVATVSGAPADAAVLVDVLGHAKDPRALLRAVHAKLRDGGRMVVAEARAYPSQSLRAPARRAFSPRALSSLLEAMGFDVDEPLGDAGPFVAFVAHKVHDDGPDHLVAAARAFGDGDVERALAELGRAAESPRTAVRVDALVTLGDVRLALGDGDGAARAFLAARSADPRDPRPAAGLARLTLAMGDVPEALALARIASALDPACSTTACALALALSRQSPSHEVTALRTAAALSPDDEVLAMAFAQTASTAGARKAGIFALERTRRYGERLPAAFHVLLADLLLGEGRRQDAVLEARLAEAVAPADAEVAALWSRLRSITS
jgi:SAM-dependent methyltransferase